MRIILRPILAFALLALAIAPLPAAPADEPPAERRLPPPSGAYKVGRNVWHWIDSSRADELSAEAGDVRELMVTAWYPAAADASAGGEAAHYAFLSRAYEDVRDDAIPGARFAAEAGRAPVVLICPGRGTASYAYTALAEELASHGYAVFAFDAPHTGFVRYPDGRTIPPSDRFQVPRDMLTGPYERVDVFYAEAERLGRGDAAFVVERIAGLARGDPAGRFTGRLDLSRMAAFGHSMGARACGAAVAADDRFRALVTYDGVPPRAVRTEGFDQPVLQFLSADIPAELALPNLRSLVPARRNDVVIARLPRAGHNSLTDRPYLRGEADQRQRAQEQLAFLRDVVRRFLDAHLRGRAIRLRPSGGDQGWIDIEHHPPPPERG